MKQISLADIQMVYECGLKNVAFHLLKKMFYATNNSPEMSVKEVKAHSQSIHHIYYNPQSELLVGQGHYKEFNQECFEHAMNVLKEKEVISITSITDLIDGDPTGDVIGVMIYG